MDHKIPSGNNVVLDEPSSDWSDYITNHQLKDAPTRSDEREFGGSVPCAAVSGRAFGVVAAVQPSPR